MQSPHTPQCLHKYSAERIGLTSFFEEREQKETGAAGCRLLSLVLGFYKNHVSLISSWELHSRLPASPLSVSPLLGGAGCVQVEFTLATLWGIFQVPGLQA